MVCPQCRTSFQQGTKCASCGSALLFQANLGAQSAANSADSSAWQQTPWGRMVVGVLLAQGLAHGLAMFWTAGHLASSDEPQPSIWSSESGFLLWQGIQALGLLIGGALTGAGQARGVLFGALVGLINGAFSLAIQQGRGPAVEPILVYGQPVLHMIFGAVGAFIGTRIWRPLPMMRVAASPEAPSGPQRAASRPAEVLAGPVCWVRVAVGIAIVVAGVIWSRSILNFIINASDGRFSIQSSSQAKLLTLEVSALVTLFGAGLAGATTRSGLKQGFFVGLVASILAVGITLGRAQIDFETTVLTVLGIWVLSLFGGWFGGMLFPPTAQVSRRRGIGSESW